MEMENKNCAVFFGSQTGNGQDLAERLVKEGHLRFNLNTMIADLDDYDYTTLTKFPSDKIAIFILSSYGEGEPTDNAATFFDFITSDDPVFPDDQDSPLHSMRFAAFGLGNSTYEHFNRVVRQVEASLQRLGAIPFADRGEGDDGTGTQEDDFLAWKEVMWDSLKNIMHLHEQEEKFEPNFSIAEKTAAAESIFLGERSQGELMETSTEYGPHCPYVAKILESKELFQSPDRNCLHIDIDLRGSGLVYETGDHVAVWPSNPDIEVERFLRVFGLAEKRQTVIHISALESVKTLPCPSPTTYEAAVRYYMEICGPISRQFLATLAAFAPHGFQKNKLFELSKNKDIFREDIGSKLLNLAQLIESISPEHPVCPIPFKVLLEVVRAMQPRYYSISSSSLVQKDSISLTTAVESINMAPHDFKGVASNYLLTIKRIQNGEQPIKTEMPYTVTGPRQKYSMSLPIHIRRSNFKLPRDSSRPIVMIGPGTGVAPFRAFMQERMKQTESGTEIGDMIMFFGCRKEQEDFIYKNEWKVSTIQPFHKPRLTIIQEYKSVLGDKFQLYTAFSRQSPGEKVYVQQRLVEHAKSLQSLVLDQKGYVYVCGSARMAREVQSTLGELLHQPLCSGEVTIHQLKTAARYQVGETILGHRIVALVLTIRQEDVW